jgi:hypothetical protein
LSLLLRRPEEYVAGLEKKILSQFFHFLDRLMRLFGSVYKWFRINFFVEF